MIGRKGSVGAVHYSPVPCWPIDTTYFVEATPSLFLPFYAYLLRDLGLGHLDRSTTIPGLRRDDYAQIRVKLPPLAEQRRIVAEIEKHFTRLDAAVAALERARANLKRYRAAVLKAACEGRLVPTEAELARAEGRDYETGEQLLQRILQERRAKWEAEELAKLRAKGKEPKDDRWKAKYKEPAAPDTSDLPELPEGWVWASPDQLSSEEEYSLAIGPFGSNLKVSDYVDSGVPLIFVRNIRSGVFGGEATRYVTEAKATQLRPHWVAPGDILVTKMGDPPGDACIYPSNQPVGIITADCIKLRLRRDIPTPSFFVFATNSLVVRSQILRITKGVAQPKVSLARFKTIGFPLPPLAEQQRIVAEVERRLSVVEELERQVEASLKRAARLRQAILRRAFAGKLVPQDPNDEPASVLLDRIRAERAAAAAGEPKRRRSRRTSKNGTRSEPAAQTLPLIEAGVDR